MNAVLTPVIKPKEILEENEISYLRKKSDLKGMSLLLHA